jgi:F-type H+-transporting ATPase subunit b
MDAARAEAAKIASEAKQASALDTETKARAAAVKIARKADAAEAKLRAAVASARAEIEAVAAEASRELVEKLTGARIDPTQAAQAVKAEMHG